MTDNSAAGKIPETADGITRADQANEQKPNPRADEPSDIQASLLQFLSGMTAQTLMHLGAMTNPVSGKVETDLVNAKYSIDLLGILQEKTRGNLTDEESEYLKNALYQLRMSYVQATQRQNREPKSASTESDNGATATAPDNKQKKHNRE